MFTNSPVGTQIKKKQNTAPKHLNRLKLIKRIFQSLTFFGFIAEPQSDCGVGCRGGHQDLRVLHIDCIHSTNWTSMTLKLRWLDELEIEEQILEDIFNKRLEHWWNAWLTFPFWASQTMIRLSEPPETRWLSGAVNKLVTLYDCEYFCTLLVWGYSIQSQLRYKSFLKHAIFLDKNALPSLVQQLEIVFMCSERNGFWGLMCKN